MRSVFILHDSYSSNAEPWIVSISDELKTKNYTVYAPKMPTPIGQDYASWSVLFEHFVEHMDRDSVVVTVGAATAFFLRYMTEHSSISLQKLIMVAPFVTPLANPSEQLVAQDFFLPEYNWFQLRTRVGMSTVVVSDNDVLVDTQQSMQVAVGMKSKILQFSGRGHFRAINGVTSFLELLPEIENATQIDVGAPVVVVTTGAVQSQFATSVGSTTASAVLPDVPLAPGFQPDHTASQVFESSPLSRQQQITHSLIEDFSKSLINASASEVSATLRDYRQGKQIQREETGMKTVRGILLTIAVIIIIISAYFAYRSYQFRVTAPEVIELQSLPLGATKSVSASLSDDISRDGAITILSNAVSDLDLAVPGDIGIVNVIDTEGRRISAYNVMRALGATSPSALYTMVESPYVVGGIKHESDIHPFVLATVNREPDAVLREMGTWEQWMVSDLVPLFASRFDIDLNTVDIRFDDRVISNRTVRVVIAEPRATAVDTDTATADRQPLQGTVTSDPFALSQIQGVTDNASSDEVNIIDIIRLSAADQTALRRTSNSIVLPMNSPLIQKNILPGDILALDSQDALPETMDAVTGSAVAPLLGSAPTILQVTDIVSSGSNFEIGTQPLTVDQMATMVGTSITPVQVPGGSSITPFSDGRQSIQGPTDLFGYAIINESAILIVSDLADIQPITAQYLVMKKDVVEQ